MRIDQPADTQIPGLLTMWKTAFGDHDGFWEMFLATAFDPNHCRCITSDGQAVAALFWFDCLCGGQKLAYIYAVVTRPDHRGKGLCRMLLEDVHAHLRQTGYAAAMLVPEKEGLREMYRKLGYTDCTTVSEFSCCAGNSPIPLRAIDPEEYGRLRRRFLPEGGVIQEGRNLVFLAQQARFYSGEDLLLAAYLDGDILKGMELLGNRDAAPGIVASLGCSTGHFRIPGKEKPFAMFYPLDQDALAPKYFGFAFD